MGLGWVVSSKLQRGVVFEGGKPSLVRVTAENPSKELVVSDER